MLPFALIIHMIFGIYFLSNEDIFPTTLNISLDTESFTKNMVSNPFLQEAIDKCVKCLPYTLLTALFIIVFLFEKSIFEFLKRIFRKAKVYTKRFSLDTFKNNYKKITYFSLPNYNMALNPQYKKLLKLNMVDYKSIQCFMEGSTLKNLILKKKSISAKPEKEKDEFINEIIKKDIDEDTGPIPKPEQLENNDLSFSEDEEDDMENDYAVFEDEEMGLKDVTNNISEDVKENDRVDVGLKEVEKKVGEGEGDKVNKENLDDTQNKEVKENSLNDTTNKEEKEQDQKNNPENKIEAKDNKEQKDEKIQEDKKEEESKEQEDKKKDEPKEEENKEQEDKKEDEPKDDQKKDQ